MEEHIARHETVSESQKVLDIIEAALEDSKAEDVVTIDLRGKSDMADFMVIASGRSQRHVSTLADHIGEHLRTSGHNDILVEGKEQCDWVLVDSIHVIVHLFRPEVRKFYNLEKMWAVPSLDDVSGAAVPA